MLLSIVECGRHNKNNHWKAQIIPVRRQSDRIEWVGPVLGPHAAGMRNLGATRATGQWLFFKDQDCEVNVASIEKICLELDQQEPQLKLIGGIYQNSSDGFFAKVYSFMQRSWVLNGIEDRRWGKFHKAKKLLGGALLVNRLAFDQLGGFSEEIGWGGEELEFVNRARLHNCGTAVSYRLRVRHKNSLNILGFIRRAWFQNFNPGYFSFRRQEPVTSALGYYRGPILYWPAMTLFLGIGTLANMTGGLVRRWEQLWS